jgi:hypothetical protein
MADVSRTLEPAGVDHDTVDRVRTAYWVERLRRLGPTESLRVADELWRHVRRLRPDWPSPEERETDLAGHIALREALSGDHHRSG